MYIVKLYLHNLELFYIDKQDAYRLAINQDNVYVRTLPKDDLK